MSPGAADRCELHRSAGGPSSAYPCVVGNEAPIVVLPGEGHTFSLGGSTFSLLVTGEQTRGQFAVTLFSVPPEFSGPRPHVHERTYDVAFVLEGTLVFTFTDGRHEAPAGSLVVIPPGVPHTFSNPGATPARAAGLSIPGGFEHYFREIAESVAPGEPPDPATVAEVSARYDINPIPDQETFPVR
jgi:quercetin dioxygenase-like cupin family protein